MSKPVVDHQRQISVVMKDIEYLVGVSPEEFYKGVLTIMEDIPHDSCTIDYREIYNEDFEHTFYNLCLFFKSYESDEDYATRIAKEQKALDDYNNRQKLTQKENAIKNLKDTIDKQNAFIENHKTFLDSAIENRDYCINKLKELGVEADD